MIDNSANVSITVTKAEALVLFDWLHNHEDAETTPGDAAEKQALWNLSCLLERELVEPFEPDYADKIQAAKRSLTAEE